MYYLHTQEKTSVCKPAPQVHFPMFICFTIGVDAVLSMKSGMTLIIAFGLILGLSSFFNKLDINPAQVEVSSVSKCTELRMISEA